MAPRVQIDDVQDIADFEDLTNDELWAFINDANTIVNDQIDPHTTDDLTLVEKYLAAHMASLKQQRFSEVRVGDVSATYEGDTDKSGWESTRYGQVAVALDPTGRLKAVPHHVETVNKSD